jgi:hypothetical protein
MYIIRSYLKQLRQRTSRYFCSPRSDSFGGLGLVFFVRFVIIRHVIRVVAVVKWSRVRLRANGRRDRGMR